MGSGYPKYRCFFFNLALSKLENATCPDQTEQMYRLLCTFVVHNITKSGFLATIEQSPFRIKKFPQDMTRKSLISSEEQVILVKIL